MQVAHWGLPLPGFIPHHFGNEALTSSELKKVKEKAYAFCVENDPRYLDRISFNTGISCNISITLVLDIGGPHLGYRDLPYNRSLGSLSRGGA